MTGVLYHPPSEIIAQMLDDLGLGNLEDTSDDDPLTGWTIFSVGMPEEPENVISVRDTHGRQFLRNHPGGLKPEHYCIQVLVRGSASPSAPYLRCKLIMQYFDTEVRRETVVLYDSNGIKRTYRVNAVTRTSCVIPSGNDGRRFFYSGNAVASIELVT